MARLVLTYGLFDRITPDDLAFLRAAGAMGDGLIIGCVTDGFAAARGAVCVEDFERRRAVLQDIPGVCRVIAQKSAAQARTDIVNHDVSLLAVRPDARAQYAHLTDITQIAVVPARTMPRVRITAERAVA